jgi:hypothetical protein
MTVSAVLMGYANRTAQTVRRWSTTLTVPEDADDQRAASLIRGALMRAAKTAAQFPGGPYYNDDHSWSHDGIRGLTHARIVEEVEISKNKMAGSPEEWGVMARVVVEGDFFDVPIAIDLAPDTARIVLSHMEGAESRYVDVDALGRAFPGESFRIGLYAANWGQARDMAAEGFLGMDDAMMFRRPVVWDLLRAQLADLPPEPLTNFSEEEFYTRFAKSSRFDSSLMHSNREMVESLARMEVEPMTPSWGEWHPAIIDVLNSIGAAQPMDGISVILNLVVEEPAARIVRDEEGFAVDRWIPVGYHNVIVGYGLHPLSAGHVLDIVRRNPTAFYDLPPSDARRYVLVGASAIQDTMLSMLRVSTFGRTEAYERMTEMPMVV